MRIWGAAAIVAVALVPGHAAASCAAPFVEVQPAVGAPGESILVEGEFFIDGCNDVGGGNACNPFPQPPEEVESAMTDVRLELRRGGTVLDAVEVDADHAGRLQADLEIPVDAEPGRYLVDVVYGGLRQQRVAVQVEAR